MGRTQRLLANGNDVWITIRWIVSEHESSYQLVFRVIPDRSCRPTAHYCRTIAGS
jgi:hypothetical protein